MAITFAVFHLDGMVDVSKHIERKCWSHRITSGARFFKNSVRMLSFPGAFPFWRVLIAAVSSSYVNGLDIELDGGDVCRRCLISALTAQVCAFASAEWSFHFPLLTRTNAMEFAETGHCLGGLLRPVSLFMVFQALRLEWVKLMLDTSSSHLTHLFWPSRSSS